MSCLRLFIVLLTLLSGGFVHASLLPFGDAPRASDEELDRMRGGFVVSWNGLEFLMPFSIDGIERLTQINGQTFLNGALVSPRVNPQALAPLHGGQIAVNMQPQTPVPPPVNMPPVDTATGSTGDVVASADGTRDTGGAGAPAGGVGETAGPADGSGQTQTTADTGTSAASGGSPPGSSAAPAGANNVPSAGPRVTTNGSLIIIQNGVANMVVLPPNVSLDSLATYIQNSVNNQVIRNITTLNLTIQSQMLAAQARLSAVLNQGLNGIR